MPVNFAFNDMTLRIWVLLRQTDTLLSNCGELVLRDAGITLKQYYVLIAVKYIKGPATQAAVARWLDRKPNSITAIVDRMEKDGLVERAKNPKDRRAIELVITAKGNDALNRSTKPAMVMMKGMMSCLSDEEMMTLIQLLERLRSAACKELNPGEATEELKINATHKIASLLDETP
jgi:DNA-binding MarR family transcriptional regulator